MKGSDKNNQWWSPLSAGGSQQLKIVGMKYKLGIYYVKEYK